MTSEFSPEQPDGELNRDDLLSHPKPPGDPSSLPEGDMPTQSEERKDPPTSSPETRDEPPAPRHPEDPPPEQQAPVGDPPSGDAARF